MNIIISCRVSIRNCNVTPIGHVTPIDMSVTTHLRGDGAGPILLPCYLNKAILTEY